MIPLQLSALRNLEKGENEEVLIHLLLALQESHDIGSHTTSFLVTPPESRIPILAERVFGLSPH